MFAIELKLADLKVGITSHFEWIKKFCKDYIQPSGQLNFSVSIEEAEVKNELEKAEETVSAEYAECLCLYRKIAEQLPLYNRCVVHGAALSYRDKAFLFIAPSGTGKTTHIRLWKQYFGKEVNIINGDKPILHITDNKVVVYGTPWAGKEGWNTNINMPLKAVCILKRAKENRIEKINPYEHIPEILQQIYMPKNIDASKRTLDLFGKLLDGLSFYILYCDISEQAVKTAFESLTDEKYCGGN